MGVERLHFLRLRPRATTPIKEATSAVDKPLPKVGLIPLFPPKGEGGRMNSPRHAAAQRHRVMRLPIGSEKRAH